MPGMPEMPKIPGIKIPDFSAPTRTLTMDLTSGKAVNAQSKADCAIPAGLQHGPKVNLHIDLPQKPNIEKGSAKESEQQQAKMPKMVIKSYWMCSETVPAGQPKALDMAAMAASGQKTMKAFRNMKLPERLTNHSDGSHAYWPYDNVKPFEKEASAPGLYTLGTNYCGGTTVTFDNPQDFLAPIDIVKPSKDIDLAKPINIEWKSVPNAAAYTLTAFSGSDKEMIMWTSASDPDPATKVQFEVVTQAEVRQLIEKGVLLPPTATSCCIPAGIFKGAGQAMLTVTAIGRDIIQTKDDITTDVLVRSTATVMLGKPMGMPGMGDGKDGAPPEMPNMPDVSGDEGGE